MRRIVTEPQESLMIWIGEKLKQSFPQDSVFLGQVKNGSLVAVIAYCNFVGESCAIHVASEGDYWMNLECNHGFVFERVR